MSLQTDYRILTANSRLSPIRLDVLCEDFVTPETACRALTRVPDTIEVIGNPKKPTECVLSVKSDRADVLKEALLYMYLCLGQGSHYTYNNFLAWRK